MSTPSSSSSSNAHPNLPRARSDEHDGNAGSKRFKLKEPGFPCDAPMGADENFSSGANGVPETPDTDMAVECILERFEQELDANKLRDPVLNELSK